MEIDPLYVDVIIRRWQALTGEQARHAETGETFAVAEQRIAAGAEADAHEYQVLHGSARTTEAVRRAIQHSQASLRDLARRYGVNPKTVAKWRKRSSVADQPTGPKAPHSTTLSAEHEAIVVAFRRHTLLPLDDCLYALQATIPQLTRSSLHRCLQRHGISRLPEVEGDKATKKAFKAYPIGARPTP